MGVFGLLEETRVVGESPHTLFLLLKDIFIDFSEATMKRTAWDYESALNCQSHTHSYSSSSRKNKASLFPRARRTPEVIIYQSSFSYFCPWIKHQVFILWHECYLAAAPAVAASHSSRLDEQLSWRVAQLLISLWKPAWGAGGLER